MNDKILNLIKNTSKIKGGEFIGVSGYVNKRGEKADFVINGAISVQNAKEKDLKSLQNVDLKSIKFSSDTEPFSKEALQALINSSIQNLSKNKSERTVNSQAQTDAYQTIVSGIKLNLKSDELHLHGLEVSRTVPKEYFAGNEKAFKEFIAVNGKGFITYQTNGQPVLNVPVNSAPLIKAKNAIKRVLELRGEKFRNFIVPQSAKVVVHGTKIEFKV